MLALKIVKQRCAGKLAKAPKVPGTTRRENKMFQNELLRSTRIETKLESCCRRNRVYW